jgi:hypothetical protein
MLSALPLDELDDDQKATLNGPWSESRQLALSTAAFYVEAEFEGTYYVFARSRSNDEYDAGAFDTIAEAEFTLEKEVGSLFFDLGSNPAIPSLNPVGLRPIPADDAVPDILDTSAYTVSGFRWAQLAPAPRNTDDIFDGYFIPGTAYTAEFKVTLKDGYDWSEAMTAPIMSANSAQGRAARNRLISISEGELTLANNGNMITFAADQDDAEKPRIATVTLRFAATGPIRATLDPGIAVKDRDGRDILPQFRLANQAHTDTNRVNLRHRTNYGNRPAPTLAGYRFGGWTLTEGGTAAVPNSQQFVFTDAMRDEMDARYWNNENYIPNAATYDPGVTFHGIWTPVANIRVTYNANGGRVVGPNGREAATAVFPVRDPCSVDDEFAV